MPSLKNAAMQDWAHPRNMTARHALGLGLVVGLHVLIFAAINSGLARAVLSQVRAPVEAMLLKEIQPQAPPQPRRLPPALSKQPAPAPLPINAPAPVRADIPAEAPAVPMFATVPATVHPTEALRSQPAPEPAAPAPRLPAPPAPVRTAAGVSTAHCEKPEYPAMSRRREEKGTVTLRFLVSVQGRVIQSEVENSSGYSRLDEAARAALSQCQFRPATTDGKAEQAWARMNYTWRLD